MRGRAGALPPLQPPARPGTSILSCAHTSPPLTHPHPASGWCGRYHQPASFQIGSLKLSGPGGHQGWGGGIQDQQE